ncbi:MAG: hypothetical protein EBY16_07945, partial [Gammaproteobacteria bacterium]|nr:hypothetical protein [Gammaproteobacteria bacterium]
MTKLNSMFQPSIAPSAWYLDKDICKVQQSEIVFTQDTMRIISSSGAGPCVILILYDRMSQQGFMTHLFAATEISPYTAGGKWLIQKCLERYTKGMVDFYMIGGYSLISSVLIRSIEHFIRILSGKINVQHIYRHLRQNWVSQIVFDFDTAEIFYYQQQK